MAQSRKIRLLKSWVTETGKKIKMGTIMGATKDKMDELVNNGTAEEYTGKYQHVLTRAQKLKTDFFKPKT